MEIKTNGKHRIEVRASSLPAINSCMRYAMARRFPAELREAHEDVAGEDERPGGFKTHVGTALHRAMELNKYAEDDLDAIIREICEGPAEAANFFDAKFKDLADVGKAVKMMVHAFRRSWYSREWTIERHGNLFEAGLASDELDGDYRLTGHIDCVRKDGRVLDLKSGATTDMNLYQEQLAAYRLLVEHQGRPSPPAADIVKVARPRIPKTKTPVSTVRYEVDLEPHIPQTAILLRKAGDMVAEKPVWQEDFTRIPASKNCQACMWCELRNTSACPETRHMIADVPGPPAAEFDLKKK